VVDRSVAPTDLLSLCSTKQLQSVSAERIRLFVALASSSLPGMLGEKPDGSDHLRP
jgi:hypothetical protein